MESLTWSFSHGDGEGYTESLTWLVEIDGDILLSIGEGLIESLTMEIGW